MDRIEQVACYYIALIRSVALVHQNSHWICQGDNFYGSHLLFERIYKSAAEDADSAAERLIGLFSSEVLDLHMQAQMIGKTLEDFSSGDPVETSLDAEKKFLDYSQKFYDILKREDKMSLGLGNVIEEIASHRETAVYLLQQVEKRGRKNARIAARVDVLKKLAIPDKKLDDVSTSGGKSLSPSEVQLQLELQELEKEPSYSPTNKNYIPRNQKKIQDLILKAKTKPRNRWIFPPQNDPRFNLNDLNNGKPVRYTRQDANNDLHKGHCEIVGGNLFDANKFPMFDKERKEQMKALSERPEITKYYIHFEGHNGEGKPTHETGEFSFLTQQELNDILNANYPQQNKRFSMKERVRVLKIATMSPQEARSILGVSEDASPEEIKKTYKRQIIEVHPDRLEHLSPNEKAKASSRAVELNVAQDILLNPERNSPFYGDIERNKEVVQDIENILNKEQTKADAWLEDIKKRREWSDYMAGEIPVEKLIFEENIAKSPAVEAKREKYRIQREKAKQKRKHSGKTKE